MIVQLWWWKTTPTVVTSIAHQSPVSTDQQLIYSTFKRSYSTHSWRFSIFYKKDSSFLLLGCVDFLERSIAPSASRRSHIPLCCGIWFMSSAWSFALTAQTALLLYAFVLVHPVILFHEIAQIVALMIFDIHSFGDTLLPRVRTALQQAHGKLKIDSVRFYTHKFQQQVIVRGAHL